jgi:membrane-associated protease RseP (regulator of RpoE activity)
VEKAFAILTMLGILSVLIIVHECGHFLVARFFGFQTPVFGFGLPFGPSVTIGKRWNTEFKIHACLLGGYVAIPELGDESNADAFGPPEKPFRKFPIWQRALVAVAGVTFNVIFAYLVCLVMVLSLGDPVTRIVSEGVVGKDNPIAQNAGFQTGDMIVDIDGAKVKTTAEAISAIQAHKNKHMTVTIRRPVDVDASASVDAKEQTEADLRAVDEKAYQAKEDGMQKLTLEMTPNEKGQIGLKLTDRVAYFSKVEGNIFEIAGYAGYKLYELTKQMLDALGQMVQGLAQGLTGAKKAAGGAPAVGIGDLHGVLAVVVFGADVAQQDWSKLFMFTIMISMDLAIINLLPWPALDGGHLAFMLFEAIRGRPMHEKAQGEIVKWGFISLIVLMVVIMVNDVSALMTGKLSFKAMKEKAKEVRQQQSDQKDASQSRSDTGTPAADSIPATTTESVPPSGTESTSPAAETKAPAAEAVTPATETKTPAAEAGTPATETKAPAAEAGIPATETKTPAAETVTPAPVPAH